MPNQGPARPANRIAASTMLAAGLLFVVLWATNRSTLTHLIVGALLIVAGLILWRRPSA